MDNSKSESPKTPFEQNKVGQEKDKCPTCGGKLTKATFRTGSMGHPPKDTSTCQKCETRT